MLPGLITGGLGLLVGGAQALWGNSEKKKYQRQIDALNAQRPQYQINPEENYLVNQAESMANQGMGAGARQAARNDSDRTLATLANAALMGGADANTLSSIADKVSDSYSKNAIYDDQVRLQNLANLRSAYARQSANRDKQWQINEYQPWKDRMTGLSQQLQGANNLFMGGLNMAGSGLMSLGTGLFGGMGSGGNQTQASPAAQGMGMQGGYSAPSGPTMGSDGNVWGYGPVTPMGGTTPEYPTTDPAVQLLSSNSNPYAYAWQ